MSVYVITGVSKGIGFELVRQISKDPKNLVIGLVRDRAATEKKVAAELRNPSNVHILHGDLTSYDSLKQAADDTSSIVGKRGVDYLVANGAITSQFDAYDPIGALRDKVKELEEVSSDLFRTNVTGNIHLFNLFLPLVMEGKIKKVIAISSGHADLDFINNLEVQNSALYAASKAALNVIVAKFNVQYKKDGVLFVSISPGVVEVGHYANVTPEQIQGLKGFREKLAAYAPDFKGAVTPGEAIPIIRSTWDKINLESGYGELISGIPVHLYGVKELTPTQAKNTTVVFHIHGRTRNYTDGEEFAHHLLNIWRPVSSEERGLVVIAFDNPNHGARAVDNFQAKDWKAGNPRHGQDLLSIIDGAVQNVQVIMTYLESYVEDSFTPKRFVSTGTSLGGHITWNLLANDQRIRHGVPIVGSPDVTGVLKDRLARQKILVDVPVGIAEWPKSFDQICVARDESLKKISGKKILIINGVDDTVVPSRFTHSWIKNYGPNNNIEFLEMENTGHTFSNGMVDKVSSWILDILAE